MKTSIDEIDRIIDAYERYAESEEMLSTRLKELQLSDPVYGQRENSSPYSAMKLKV